MSQLPWGAILAFVPALYVSLFVHELGHAAAAWRTGFVVTSFGVGLGRPWWSGSWRGARVYLCPRHWTQGLTCVYSPDLFPSRSQWAWVLAGGSLANGALAAAAAGLGWWVPWGQPVWLTLALLNAWMLLNLVPASIRSGRLVLISDGGRLLSMMREGASSAAAPARIATAERLASHWEAVGDVDGHRLHLLVAALAWADMGEWQEAARLHDAAMGLPRVPPPFVSAYAALVAAVVARQAGRLKPASAHLAAAEEGFSALGHPGGRLLARWEGAELRLAAGEGLAAAAELRRLAAAPLVARDRPLRAALLASQVVAAAALRDDGEVHRLRAEYERVRRADGAGTSDLRVAAALGRRLALRGHHAAAAGEYETALTAARGLYEQFPDRAGQERFRAAQEQLAAEAVSAWELAGVPEAAERAARMLPAPAELQRQRQQAVAARNRRRHRLGLLLGGANLALAAGAVLVPRLLPPFAGGRAQLPREGLALVAGLAIYTGAALLYSLGLAIRARFRPGTRDRGGDVTLLLALLPWFGAIAVALFPLR